MLPRKFRIEIILSKVLFSEIDGLMYWSIKINRNKKNLKTMK